MFGELFGYVGYIYHRGAFGVARFDKSGNSRASTREASDRAGSTFFCICIVDVLFTNVIFIPEPNNEKIYNEIMKELENYEAPVVEVIEVEVEKGFATSNEGFGEWQS